jgi:hypothetical protein
MFSKIKITGNAYVYSLLALFCIAVFGYFYWIGDYLLFFQEQQSLFIFSGDYFYEFFSKPGGLLELAGKFLTQFYASRILGSLILALVLTLPGFILLNVNKRLMTGTAFSFFLPLVPSCLLLLMQAHYYHMMEYNLGFLLVFLYFLLTIISERRSYRYTMLILFPLFYFLTGAYAWIFLGMYVMYSLFYIKGKQKYLYPAILLSVAAGSFIIFKEILFLQSVGQLILYPLPFINDPTHKFIFRLCVPIVILYPFAGKIAVSVKNKWINTRFFTIILSGIVLVVTILLMVKNYNPQTARVIKLEKLIFEKKWNEAIEFHEGFPSRNMIGQYFYNIALSETDQLCDRLFKGRQDFGTGSLILPWSNEHLGWGAYFFYSVGLINEAHRWAYEEMVVYGYRPQNVKLLVQTDLMNGNYRMTEKYINILKRTIWYNTWAAEYEKLLDDPEQIKAHPELGKMIKILPGNNFFIQLESPQNNLTMLLLANPDNRKAFEYEMAWHLLTKNVEAIVNNIKKMRTMDYKRIPRHIEEAALTYFDSKGVLPDLGGLTISNETRLRFEQYVERYIGLRQIQALSKEQMQKEFGDTFWFYFHFN